MPVPVTVGAGRGVGASRHVASMSREPAERVGTGRDDTGRGGIATPKHSGRLRGKGAILLEVSHRPARVRFPPPPLKEMISFDCFLFL